MSDADESRIAEPEEGAELSAAALFDRLLAKSHPLMVDAFRIAAIAHWYDRGLFAAIRHTKDGRDDGLYERLQRYTFVTRLESGRYGVEQAEPIYCVRGAEREALHRRWIAEDPEAYREAHRRALAYMREHPDPNPYAQAQNELYHQLFVDQDAGTDLLATLFRTYRNERTLIAIDRLLDTGREAAGYLALLNGGSAADLSDMLTFLRARLAQLRDDWGQSQDALKKLSQKGDRLNARLRPYVVRAEGHALAREKKYVEAIRAFREAYRQFGRLLTTERDPGVVQVERGYTLIALGDADVGLAESVGGFQEREAPRTGRRQWLRNAFYFLVSLPLVLYLSFTLGRRVWNPQFWPVLIGLDWIIARLVTLGVGSYRRADALLEAFGQPSERRVADEKLASVSLKLGDSAQARRLLQQLLDQTEAPLGPYRLAVVQMGLAEAHLHLRQPEQALAPLRAALPAFEAYEDRDLQARAGELLGQALLAAGDQEEALGCLETACAQYQRSGAWAEATRLAEQLQAWLKSAAGGALPAVRERAQALITGLKRRHYPGHYRHPWLVVFRQATLTFLPFVLLLGPLLTIHLESSTTLTPQIAFRPKPILDPSATVTAQISEGVVAHSEVYHVVVSDTALRVTFGFVLLYLVASFLVGLAAIAFTPLRSVEEGGRAETVSLDSKRIARGEQEDGAPEAPRGPPETAAPEEVPWDGVAEFIQADVRFWNQSLRDNSHFGLAALREPLVVEGHTAWYDALRNRAEESIPRGTRVVKLDSDVLRSPLGLLYLINLAAIGALALLALFIKGIPAVSGLPGTGFAVDLYPFFYIVMAVAPLWWGVIQPLRRSLYLHPRSRLPLGVLAGGLLLALIQVLLRFRPLLTVANLYVPLVTILLCASGAAAVWLAQVGGRKVWSTPLRVGGALLAGAACLLMLTAMARDVYAYYHLVRGNVLTTRALRVEQGPDAQTIGERALAAYHRAAQIGSEPFWGLDTRSAARLHLGIPAAARFPWLSAMVGEAAWQVRNGNLAEAGRIYSETLEYTDQPDEIYAAWAVARFGRAAKEWGEQDHLQYTLGLRDLDKAIDRRPDKATYYLWRAVAHHALGEPQDCSGATLPGQANPLVEATRSYTMALALGQDRDREFDSRAQERAWTGLGWIQYLCGDYKPALDSFRQAKGANPESASARLAEGYALYALKSFTEAQTVWQEAAELEPRDPTILLALATSHWKQAALAGGPPKPAACAEYPKALKLYSQALPHEGLWEQADADVAYTYRTLGQMHWLLGQCPAPGQAQVTSEHRVKEYREAVDSYSQALALDDQKTEYWFMRGRLAYAIASLLHDARDPEFGEWLPKALADIRGAARLNPNSGLYLFHLGRIAYDAWRWTEPRTAETAQWLDQALVDLQAAIAIDPVDRPQGGQWENYTPNTARDQIRDRALAYGDERLADAEFETALPYYELVARNLPLNARAALKAGLTSLLLARSQGAMDWYRQGLERVRTTGLVKTARDALKELQVQATRPGLDIRPVVELFKQNGIEPEAPDAVTAFELGLAALGLGRTEEAKAWYGQGLDLARAAHDANSPQEARAALYLALLKDESLPVGEVVALLNEQGVELAPETAQLAFELAPAALAQGNQAEAARLSNRGIELAAAGQDIQAVRNGGFGLRDYMLAHPELDRAEAYWPLQDNLPAREAEVAALPRPDLYWAYRAEFGYRLLRDRQLMREQPMRDEVYERIFAGVIADIERAYALNPDEHKKMRDFFVDSNVGWLYLRRGDDYGEKGNYVQALADYEKAATRIRPASVNGALDRTEDLFKAGLTALRLGQLDRGADWYDQGIELVQELGAQFGLKRQVGPAIKDLTALVEERPELVLAAEPILERLAAVD